MKTGVLPAVGFLLAAAPSAHALVNLELDNNDLTLVAPSSVTTVFQVDGTITLTNGWTNTMTTLYTPYQADLITGLDVSFDSDYLTWQSGSQSSSYAGAIFDISVSSSTPGGLYFAGIGSPSGLAEIDMAGSDPTGAFRSTDTEVYEAHVVPAPEPGGLLAFIWMGSVAFVRRRR